MVEMRMGQQDLVDHVHAVALLELQERRYYARPAVDQRVPDDLAALPLDQRVRDVGLPVGISDSAFGGARAVQAELNAQGRLNAVKPQEKRGHGSNPAAKKPASGFSKVK